MLINHDGLVFCGERRDTPGGWQMPQGGIQDGETADVAVMRELKEETGTTKARIIARSTTPLYYDFPDYLQSRLIFKNKYRGQQQYWFAMQFLGVDADIDLVAHPDDTEGPEFLRWRWVPAPDLPGLIVPFKRAIYEAIVAEFMPIIAAVKQQG